MTTGRCPATTGIKYMSPDLAFRCELGIGHRGNHWIGDQRAPDGWRVMATWRQEESPQRATDDWEHPERRLRGAMIRDVWDSDTFTTRAMAEQAVDALLAGVLKDRVDPEELVW